MSKCFWQYVYFRFKTWTSKFRRIHFSGITESYRLDDILPSAFRDLQLICVVGLFSVVNHRLAISFISLQADIKKRPWNIRNVNNEKKILFLVFAIFFSSRNELENMLTFELEIIGFVREKWYPVKKYKGTAIHYDFTHYISSSVWSY